MITSVRPIKPYEFDDLIFFDKVHLLEVMKKIGVEEEKCAPMITHAELETAYAKKDILLWVLVDEEIAGYMWREKRAGYLFGAGAAIKQKFYGMGLSDYIIQFTEKAAREGRFSRYQLAVIPVNGRVISAHMRHGFQITQHFLAYSDTKYPGVFRCIMEKNLQQNSIKKTVVDRVEVSSADEEQLKSLIDKGYVGVRFIKQGSGGILGDNRMVFEKFSN